MKAHQSPTKPIRCAIYTRKSSEEGLEQSFNSLHAQREACEAYILSQAHEGWKLIDTDYDDGGFSGGTTERPALQRLLQDMDDGEIDLILVYKVDRLSRSLADFVRLIERFDQQDISFVSVTQQFNTASSMGRLTLNVLLSFAQFEREVTGERIRDKIAASKMKGMWMGGVTPIGYDVVDKQLVVNIEEAQKVRRIFEQYVQVASVLKLQIWCEQQGLRSKSRFTPSGKQYGDCSFSRGALLNLLKNPTYKGMIHHKGKLYPGRHQAIVDDELWQKVQDKLEQNRRRRAFRTAAKSPSLLTGLLFDDKGNRMSPTHTKKNNRRYYYYVSQAKIKSQLDKIGKIVSVPDRQVDRPILRLIASFLDNNAHQLLASSASVNLDATQQQRLLKAGQNASEKLLGSCRAARIEILHTIKTRIDLSPSEIRVSIDPYSLFNYLLGSPVSDNTNLSDIALSIPTKLQRSGIEEKLIIPFDNDDASQPDPTLGRAALKAFQWLHQLLTGQVKSVEEIAACEDVNPRYVGHRLQLAFLSPQEIYALVEGKTINQSLLSLKKKKLPLSWQDR